MDTYKRVRLDGRPGQRSHPVQVDDSLGKVAWLLDDLVRVPGLNWRFGLDSLIGLIPGAGDVVTSGLSVLILFRAIQYRMPAVIIFRMVLNTLIDLMLGAVPLVGDLFDFAWKSNAMNLKLFRQHAGEPEKSTLRHYVFITLIALLFGGTLLLVSYVTYALLRNFLS